MIRFIATGCVLAILLCAYGISVGEPLDREYPPTYTERREMADWDTLFSDRDLIGSVLLYDAVTDSLFSNDFAWKTAGALPASTFKIVNTAIGLEMGLLEDRNTIFEWDGTTRNVESWNKDMTLAQAYARSCVPCYQGLARRIGPDSMNHYLAKLDYGDFRVSADSIDLFWLLGSARITPLEQIEFLRRIHEEKLPLQPETLSELKAIMKRSDGDGYDLYGKTGWSVDGGHNNGWFVGYAVQEGRVRYVAVNVEPVGELDRELFLKSRVEIAVSVLVG
ncbi:penicillin-binding transpeptidase domain-containing protein [Lewinella sp. 4G2]|uniref:penicillin-binding transpeptidase domain-containing protein n=1 Tax=Lewinella sp. 4G2 TaxID=1803372 RepID=UPI0007B46BD7|nr:penicillin-binding transpeptidase domain-containing protein [Lewinella sp. 4G2]OAV43257.1 hypothetical protein A3850_001545 [Lewinella sp. 4G2]